jgi:hypothetical protein
MSSILGDFVAKSTKSINDTCTNASSIKGYKFTRISYSDYSKLGKRISNEILYICDDAPNAKDIAQGNTDGVNGIVELKGKVFKGRYECPPINDTETLYDIALRMGCNDVEITIDLEEDIT